MKKLIPVLVMALMQVTAWAQKTPAPSDTSKKAEITFQSESHDFGKLKEGINASYEFIFKNTGNAPLILTNVNPSCGCTATEWTKEPVKPGATGTIRATYNTTMRPGDFHKSIVVTSNARNAMKTLMIHGTVEGANAQPEPAKPEIPVH